MKEAERLINPIDPKILSELSFKVTRPKKYSSVMLCTTQKFVEKEKELLCDVFCDKIRSHSFLRLLVCLISTKLLIAAPDVQKRVT